MSEGVTRCVKASAWQMYEDALGRLKMREDARRCLTVHEDVRVFYGNVGGVMHL